MPNMQPEEVDLAELCRVLHARFSSGAPTGYVLGKTLMREVVMQVLSCSELQAEELVDTLESRRMIRYQGHKRNEVDDLESFWTFS
jgi:hypothetical protein